MGNILECEYCGAAYRRRTERGKVVWRCASRMEKRRGMCADYLTLKEEYIKEVLGDVICERGIYAEEIVRDRVDRILIFDDHSIIFKMDGSQVIGSLQNK